MVPKFLKKVKPGEELTAQSWNDLIDFVNRLVLNIGPQSGLIAQTGPDGTTLAVGDRPNRFLAVANGNISKRSGTTAGTGNVYLVTVSGTTLTTTSISYPVYNPSSNAMTSTNGIDSGQYCWIEEYPSGKWCVSPLECS